MDENELTEFIREVDDRERSDLIEAACEAEEEFVIEDLEAYADRRRKEIEDRRRDVVRNRQRQ